MRVVLTRGERFQEARKNVGKTMDVVQADTGISKSLIQALEDDENDRGVRYQEVAKLAKYYNVSLDYLLCITDYPDQNHSIKELGELTGLSPQAIAQLIEFKKNPPVQMAGINTLNELLEDIDFYQVVEDICRYKTLQKMTAKSMKSDDELQIAIGTLTKNGYYAMQGKTISPVFWNSAKDRLKLIVDEIPIENREESRYVQRVKSQKAIRTIFKQEKYKQIETEKGEKGRSHG